MNRVAAGGLAAALLLRLPFPHRPPPAALLLSTRSRLGFPSPAVAAGGGASPGRGARAGGGRGAQHPAWRARS